MTDDVNWQILVVDDDPEICQRVKAFLEAEHISADERYPQVMTECDFGQTLRLLESRRFDLLILDVRLGSYNTQPPVEDGVQTLEAVQKKCFVPVVFYTGLPNLVRHLESHVVRVVEKGPKPQALLEAVRSVFATRIPTVNRALLRHVQSIQRDYMWSFVAQKWDKLSDNYDAASLAYLLARRLAMSLSGSGIGQFIQELGGPPGSATGEAKTHPAQYYLIPPVEKIPLAGDVYAERAGEKTSYWVLLTPSCDLLHDKSERVLLAQCDLLTDTKECKAYLASPQPSKKQRGILDDLLKDNRSGTQADRYRFLPGVSNLPDLVVDFQHLMTKQTAQLKDMERLASLDSPYAEALLSRFVRYYSRLGVPDLDTRRVLERLRPDVSR